MTLRVTEGRWSVLTTVLVFFVASASHGRAQSLRSLVHEGNGFYKGQKFNDAEVNYRKALEKEPELVQGHFNLGNALYKQGKFDESMREFEAAASKAEHRETKAEAYYNIGNAHLKSQQYQEAVKSYVESLKLNPHDAETKYNLSYALAKMREQQQERNDKNKEKKQDQQNQQNKDQQKQEQERRDQQNQQNQQSQQNQKQQQQQDKQMSKADAQRILDVLKDNEKDVQKKLRVRPAVRAKVEKDW